MRRVSRLGFPVKVMAREDLKSSDARRAASLPHLKVSLEYVDAILDHLVRHGRIFLRQGHVKRARNLV